jgi:toxin YhaV
MNCQWAVFYFVIFYEDYKKLAMDVYKLKQKDPVSYKFHPKTKLLKKIKDVIWKRIATDPKSKEFHLGDTFPKKFRHYKRAKAGMPNRYRLFFRYKSQDGKIIIVWMNSENTLRSSYGKSDPYVVFLKMLENKTIPADWKSLMSKSIDRNPNK